MPPSGSVSQRIALIGPGRMGQALGRLLARSGVTIGWVVARRLAEAREAARFIGSGRPVALNSSEFAQAKALLITTSDSALFEVAENVASRRKDWQGSVALHTSGAWPASGPGSVLACFSKRGARTGSLHPLQTVPGREAGVRNLVGCWWALEGDRAALQLARRWVRKLNGRWFTISPTNKAAYHAAAVVSCGGVVALMETSRRLLEVCGVKPRYARKMLQGFVSETAKNFAELGLPRALTGPAVRGDWTTIKRHVDELRRRAPGSVKLYRELTKHMLDLAGKKLPGAGAALKRNQLTG